MLGAHEQCILPDNGGEYFAGPDVHALERHPDPHLPHRDQGNCHPLLHINVTINHEKEYCQFN